MSATLLAVALAAAVVVEASSQPSASPLGGELRINTYTSGPQQASLPIVDAAGQIFVVWDGRGTEDRNGIYGRRLDAAGAPLSGEQLLVGASVNTIQSTPDGAFDGAGRFVVAWRSEGQDGDDDGVFVRRFDTAGNPLGAEQQVNVTTANDQNDPAVAIFSGGGFVVAWRGSDADGGGVFARRFDANGQPLGGEVPANTSTDQVQNAPAVATLADGSFVVAWQSVPGFGSSAALDGDGAGVFLQRFAADGSKLGGETLVNTTTQGNQLAPAIARGADGRFLVTWEGPDGGGSGIFAQLFNADGSKSGVEIQLNTTVSEDQIAPSLAPLVGGGFVAAWSSLGQDGDLYAVVARELTAAGLPVGQETAINQSANATQNEVRVSATPDGGWVATWTSKHDQQAGADTYLRRFAAGGCETGGSTLCLNQSRFAVDVAWEKPDGTMGAGSAVPLTSDTGFYWFFAASNVEMVIKVLNACSLNGKYWVFAGGLTNVETHIDVLDLATGAQRAYVNPQRTPFAPIQDTAAFDCSTTAAESAAGSFWADSAPIAALAAGESSALLALLGDPDAAPHERAQPAPQAITSCTTDTDTLCLNASRFTVEVDWRNQQGASGVGTAVPLTSDTGFFWFFRDTNVEMVIKVLTACGVNGNYWVFAGGLTNVEVTIHVTDTMTGVERTYVNPLATQFQPLQDTAAFACST